MVEVGVTMFRMFNQISVLIAIRFYEIDLMKLGEYLDQKN